MRAEDRFDSFGGTKEPKHHDSFSMIVKSYGKQRPTVKADCFLCKDGTNLFMFL
jgi:hypothetical protein